MSKIIAARLFKANSGTAGVNLTFTDNVVWTGWLSPKTKDKTISILIKLGFQGDNLNEISNISNFKNTPDVILSGYGERNGYKTADWINFADEQKQVQQTEMEGLDFEGDLARLRNENFSSDDIPF